MGRHGREPMDELPKVSIVIVNWNGKEYLEKCLESIINSEYPKDKLEIIVVDNGSTDGSVEMVKNHYPDVILVRSPKNLGYAMGSNMGIRVAKGDIVVILNNDVYVDSKWLVEIIKHMKRPDVGIVGAKLVYPSGVIQSCGCIERFIGFWECIGTGTKMNNEKSICKDGMEVDYVSGAALAIKREIISKVGMFDPYFFAYMEDVDLCYRVRQAGFKVVVASNSIVYHYESATWRKMPFKKFYLDYRNKILFLWKYHSRTHVLKYLTFYPIWFTLTHFVKVVRGDAVIQKLNKDVPAIEMIISLLKIYLLNIFAFVTSIIPGLLMVRRYSLRKRYGR